MSDSESVRLPALQLPGELAPPPEKAPQPERENDDPAFGSRAAATGPAREPGVQDAKVPGRLAVAGIGGSLLIMLLAALVRQDWMFPHLRLPAGGFPFAATGVDVSKKLVVPVLWASVLMGGGGVAAGLVAARRGARPPMRLILVAAVLVVAVLAVLPPSGSTDALDYASYGRLLLLGHNPYIATPHLLRVHDPGFGHQVSWSWQHQVSVYGPIATFEQYAAAVLGGNAPARVVFWLKIWNALAFVLVALVADRMLRNEPARRLRAHLLWTVNPLLVWGLIAAGHLDVLAAAAGLLGLLALGPQTASSCPSLQRVIVAGALVGVAADIKINYLVFGAGLAWALRRWPGRMLAAAAGGLLVMAPTYAVFGTSAVVALVARRNDSTADSFYGLTDLSSYQSYLGVVAVVLLIAMVLLLLARMPAADPLRPALRPALALGLAWLVIWPYQLPWYDTMAICLLLFYPASRLDWLVIGRLTAASLANMPGNPRLPPGHLLIKIDQLNVHQIAPGILLACAIGLVLLAVTGQWRAEGSTGLAGLADGAALAPARLGQSEPVPGGPPVVR